MNLHGVASGVIAAVNPMIPATLQVSTGSTTGPGGIKAQTYAPARQVRAQVQPLTYKDLQQVDGINIEGVRWKIYLFGQVDGVVRPEKKGGDLVTISAGRHQGVWLVAQVLEQYPDWVAAAITLQNAS